MKHCNFILAALILTLGSGTVATAQNLSASSEKLTTKHVQALSADDMLGRASFTPVMEKAVDYIGKEFRKIGLKPLEEGGTGKKTSHRQSLTVYRLTTGHVQVQLNGSTIPREDLFASTAHKTLNWQNSGARSTITIAAGANFRQEFAKANALDQDALVLVHPSHEKMFATYRNYFGKGGIKQEIGKGASKVMVLTNKTTAENYSVAMENSVKQLPLFNVAGMIEGKRKDELVVFSGHYDHIGIQDAVDGDNIGNGADDDASGTTAMLLLARHFKKQRQPKHTLLFEAFTAEEIGGYGSRHFSEQLNPDNIVAIFNTEMIGKPSKFGPNTAYLTGFDKSDLGTLLQGRLEGTAYSIHPYPEQNLFYRSDNATLARLGVPAHTISSVQIDQDKTYHTVKDEFEKLDMKHMSGLIKAVALASQGVVDGTDTPSRVDKAQVRQ